MTNDLTPMQKRARTAWTERFSTDLKAKHGAADAAIMAMSVIQGGTTCVIGSGAHTTGREIKIGFATSDKTTGLGIAIEHPKGSLAIALSPPEALQFLADLAALCEDACRYTAFQGEGVDLLARTVETGLSDLKLSNRSRNEGISASDAAYQAGVREGLRKASYVLDEIAKEYGDFVDLNVVSHALKTAAASPD